MPGNSPIYPTNYPDMTALRTVVDDIDDVIATDHNDPALEIIALANELGLLPKGTCANLTARLTVSISDDGNLNPAALQTTVPTYPTSAGAPGQRANDANFVYICHATNTWKRATIAAW